MRGELQALVTEIFGPNSSSSDQKAIVWIQPSIDCWKLETILELKCQSPLMTSYEALSNIIFQRIILADTTMKPMRRTQLKKEPVLGSFAQKTGVILESIYIYLKQMNEVQRFKFNRISIILLTIKRRPLNTMEKYVKIFTFSPLTKISIRENSSRALSTAASTSFT